MKGIINGNDLLLYVNTSATQESVWKAIAHSTSHKIDLKADTKERITKDTGKWKSKMVSGMAVSISCEALVSHDAAYGYEDLLAKCKSGEAVLLKYGSDQTGESYEEGLFVITSISQDAKAMEDVTMSVSFENSGEVFTKVHE